jgi:hypothetical protein
MKYKIPVVIPKSTWQRQTADMKGNTEELGEALTKGYDPTISRVYLERMGVSTEYKDEAGYVFRDTVARSSPYKLYVDPIEEQDIVTQLKTIAKKQHPNIDWWFDEWLDSPRTTTKEDRETMLLSLKEEICVKPKV